MSVFRLNIVFSGVDFDDDEVFDTLGKLPNVTWRSQCRYAFATAVIDAPTALEAADFVTRQVMKLVPSARPIRLDDDLVSIPDVAGRVGVTREAVRNWANGTRHANFPLPRCRWRRHQGLGMVGREPLAPRQPGARRLRGVPVGT